ncbi:hypothetical protein ABC382_00860 [Lysinibacillus sp. 1P01SD]|uniref:hypothetical protein n=1 Tax=Lysinibacillus sp. 1P01SD TaxID=3132285 RepID=UPI0039A33922
MKITIEEALTSCINDFIRVEKTITGFEYQQESYYIRGQISILISILGEKWSFHETGQCYYAFLKYLVDKYKLEDVKEINDLKESHQVHIPLQVLNK